MKRTLRFGKLSVTSLAMLGASCVSAIAGETLTVYPDGTGEYATIQAAVDAASSGDTVFLKAGVYETGGKEDTFATKMMNRVFINKTLTLAGESREKTIIKGAHATTAEDSVGLGLGSDAIRCIAIGAADVVVSNLTVTGGATHYPSGNDACEGNGGGIYAISGITGIQIVDCIISNNVAKRAAGIRCNDDDAAKYANCLVVRCWLDNNKAANRDPIGRGCLFAHCLMTRQYSASALFYNSTLVNCTLADGNCRNAGETTGFKAYNCLFADTWYKADNLGCYYNCTLSGNTSGEITATLDNCQTGANSKGVGYDHFIAPPLADYRLHSSATYAIGKGSSTYLEKIPEAFRYTDYYGNSFAVSDGTVAVGCSQVPVTPVSGKVVFAPTSFSAIESRGTYGYTSNPTNDYCFGESGRVLTQMRALGYFYADVWPKVVKLNVKLRDARWQAFFGFEASGADEVWRRAYLDGTFEICAPRNAQQVLTLTPKASSKVLYVKQSSTVTPETGTADAPYTDLQAAIDAVPANAYATIRVNGGTFATGGCAVSDTQTNRVVVPSNKAIHLIGVGGPSRNIIVGARDTSDSAVGGMGPNGMRCLRLANGDSAVQGFTLTGGASHYSDSVGTAKRGAGIWLAQGAQAFDCVISNNVGRQGAAINSTESGKVSTGYAFRCLIAENSSLNADGSIGVSGLVRSTSTASCLYRDNQGSTFGAYEFVDGWFNTYATDKTTSGFLTTISSNYNCLVYAPSAELNTPVVRGGVVNFGSGAVRSTSSDYSTAPALVADPANDDYRLGTLSPAVTSGIWTDDAYRYLTRDVNGNPIRLVDGKPVCGAVHTFVPTIVSAVRGVTPVGTNVVTSATVTFTATEARPFLGFAINGVTQEVDGVTYEYTVPTDATSPGTALSVSPIYDTNWYVDAGEKGDDTAVGTAAHPKKTLKGGLEHAISGDTVHVAAGVYDTLTMQQTKQLGNNNGDYDHLSRAVVPEGVSLMGAGAESTFIVGGSDSTAAESDKGCGPNAIRCVALGANARLSGFTLTGGRTDADGNADNFHGGGVLGCCTAGKLPVISDCIISNCVARRGGGGMFGEYNRCRFFENAVIRSGNGPAMRGNGANTAIIRNSIADSNTGYATFYMVTKIVNCTIGADNEDANGNKGGVTVAYDCIELDNVLLAGRVTVSAQENVHCRLNSCAYGPDTKHLIGTYVTTNGCKEATSLDALRVDPLTYMPIVGENIGVDVADENLYDGDDSDCSGNKRFVNGEKLDIGAVEADWLTTYSKAIGHRMHVTSADGNVELIDGKVTIPSGAKLTATVGNGTDAGRTYRLGATVAADSTCGIDKDGAAWTTLAAGTSEVKLNVAGTTAELVFSALGAGSTTLNYLCGSSGFILLFH